MKDEILEKVTLNLYQGDRETLQSFYPRTPWSVVVREAIHDLCKRLRTRETLSEKEDTSEPPTVRLDGPSSIGKDIPERPAKAKRSRGGRNRSKPKTKA